MFPKKHILEVVHINETFIHIENVVYKRHDHEGQELRIIETQTRIIEELVALVGKSGEQKPIFALTTILNNNQKVILMADVRLVLGTPNTGVFTLLDNKTLQPISASFSNQVVTNNNTDLADIALDPSNPNQVIGNGKVAGSGTVVITTHADYTDPGDQSAQSADFTVTKNFTVVATADGATFDVQFS